MLVGVVSFNVLRVMDATDPRALGVLLVGYFFQGQFVPETPWTCSEQQYSGLGFFMTFFYLCIYVIRCVIFFRYLLQF